MHSQGKLSQTACIQVIIPNSLRRFTGGESELECKASNLTDLVAEINHEYPEFKNHLCDTSGKIKSYFNVYIDGEDSRHLDGMNSQIKGQSEVVIVAAVAGG